MNLFFYILDIFHITSFHELNFLKKYSFSWSINGLCVLCFVLETQRLCFHFVSKLAW